MMTGVPASAIVECRVPYQPQEILKNYDENTTVLKFAVGAKDMDEDPRFKFGNKRDGSPSYLQDADTHRGNFQPFKKHGYVVTAPTLSFKVLGSTVQSATKLRALYQTLDDKKSDQFIIDLFGNTDPNFKQMLDTALMRNDQQQVAESDLVTDRNNMREIVKQMLTDYIEQEDDIEKLNFLVKQIIHKEIKKRGTKYQISDESINEQENSIVPKRIKPMKVPKFPEMPTQAGVADDGTETIKTKSGGWMLKTAGGDFVWDKAGSPSMYIGPNLAGIQEIHNLKNKTIVVKYRGYFKSKNPLDPNSKIVSGDSGDVAVDTKATYDSTGKLIKQDELGIGSGDVRLNTGAGKMTFSWVLRDDLRITILGDPRNPDPRQDPDLVADFAKKYKKNPQALRPEFEKFQDGDSLADYIKKYTSMIMRLGGKVRFSNPQTGAKVSYGDAIKQMRNFDTEFDAKKANSAEQ